MWYMRIQRTNGADIEVTDTLGMCIKEVINYLTKHCPEQGNAREIADMKLNKWHLKVLNYPS